jgi:hypothetical protein
MGIHLLSSSAICAKDEKPIFFAIDGANNGFLIHRGNGNGEGKMKCIFVYHLFG